ncbi:LytTR family DNA-binding domain-containing protein [Sphingobacterium sp.]|uniref:LytTR family DNA-binding domain-containing protein n=1 Tax=Sphingobacterium sp. TaxID=341027 RepID=UPI0031D811D2
MTNETTILDRFIFRLIAVLTVGLYVSELGSRQSIFERLLTKEFYYEYGVTVLICLTVTEFTYHINRVLSRKYPLHDQTGLRILLQVLFGLAIPAVIVFLMAALYFGINGINIFRTDYLIFVFPLVIVLLILLNLLFILVPYFVHAYRLQKANAIDNHNPLVQSGSSGAQSPIKAYDGLTVVLVNPGEILSAYIIGGKVVLQMIEGRELLTDYTLDELEVSLPKDGFFRINRQLITSRRVCKGYKALEYGKLEVEMDFSVPVKPIVSQLKSKRFKEWMEVVSERQVPYKG